MTRRQPTLADGSLERSLGRRFRLTESEVETSGGRFKLVHPADPEDLINEVDFEHDERLPYWADIWPSSTALAGIVAALAGSGQRALEFGCGIGLVAAAAARAGFAVTATDYYDDALLFAQVNTWRNAGAEISTRHVDWRDLPTDLGPFDLVLASDVLYERTYAELVANAIARSLGAGGRGLVTDPGRAGADAFVEACAMRGLFAAVTSYVAFSSGDVRQRISVYEIIRAEQRAAPTVK